MMAEERTMQQRIAMYLEQNPGKTEQDFYAARKKILSQKGKASEAPNVCRLPDGCMIPMSGISPDEVSTITKSFAKETF